MSRYRMLQVALGCLLTVASAEARSDVSVAPRQARQVTPSGPGFAGVYGVVASDQAEFVSTPDAIRSAAASGAPTLVWEALEHGEKVECLDCITDVAPLLYDQNAKNREIAAWWLRRRIFGVFGPGEVYEQTIKTLQADTHPERRAFAAYALGEFFATPGIAACAQALIGDRDARVRAAAASALGRLNDDGAGALAKAFGDVDASVKLAALASAISVNSFSGLSSLAALTADPSAEVRRRTVEALDALVARDTVAAVAATARKDGDAGVRAAACHALGSFGDASALPVLQELLQNDPDTFVRDQAQIALRRL